MDLLCSCGSCDVCSPPGDSGPTMSIVAHIDDDLLFQNPDIQHSINSGEGHTTVYLTAGDAGADSDYWEGREAGAKAAYSNMTGANDWVDAVATFSDGQNAFSVRTSFLESQPDVRLYFLRLPDGNPDGGGYQVTENQSLERLWEGEIDRVETVDGANSYDAAQVTGLLLGLMELHQPSTLMLQDHASEHAHDNHSDHVHSSMFALEAQQYYENEHETVSYLDYSSRQLGENLSEEDAQQTLDTFLAYAAHDPAVLQGTNVDGHPVIPGIYQDWTQRQYQADGFSDTGDEAAVWTGAFSNTADGWDNARHVRDLADVNGDGRADIVGFGESAVVTAASDASGLGDATVAIADFTQASGGWYVGEHDREMADVNGDGLDDIVGFGTGETIVALSNGTGFEAISFWSYAFGSNDGWNAGTHERELGDVNGDGMADIVAFGDSGTTVALSDGSGFGAGEIWIDDFGFDQGWRMGEHERQLADVNGDGLDDIVGFGDSHVIVATSNGRGFDPVEFWSHGFSSDNGWSASEHEREMADANGDGLADIIAFGDDGVHVALSNGSGFEEAVKWSEDFGNADGWSQSGDVRTANDVNGDGLADIVAFGDDGVKVQLSDGSGFVSPEVVPGTAASLAAQQPFDTLEFVAAARPEPAELLENGGLEADISDGAGSADADVRGWTNDNGGIEGWGNGFRGIETEDGGNVVDLDARGDDARADNLYQDVQTLEGEVLELNFSGMQQGGGNDGAEVYWRDELIDTVRPESSEEWTHYSYSLVGSGGSDRLEFRELAAENDGKGPLLDNISLLAGPAEESAESLMESLFLPVDEEDSVPLDEQEDELLEVF